MRYIFLRNLSRLPIRKWLDDSPSHLEEYTAYYGTLNESRDGVSFKNVPKGKYMLTLKRILKLETKDNDAPAKGEIRLVFYDKKEVTVK